MKTYENIVVKISNYATDDLDKELWEKGQEGYKLVSTVMAVNRYNITIMYLFFVKEIDNDR